MDVEGGMDRDEDNLYAVWYYRRKEGGEGKEGEGKEEGELRVGGNGTVTLDGVPWDQVDRQKWDTEEGKSVVPWSLACRVVDEFLALRKEGKVRTKRRFLGLVSDLKYPQENKFFREKWELPPYHYLETSYAATEYPPYVGRLYISFHLVAYHCGGMFYETSKIVHMRDVRRVSLDGFTISLVLDGGQAQWDLKVLNASDCHKALSSVRQDFFSSQCFGVPLHVLQSRHTTMTNVPRLMTDCIEHLRRHGALSEVGLFRVSGAKRLTDHWLVIYDQGFAPNFDEGSLHDVASLLKEFLTKIPGGFFSTRMWEVVKPLLQASPLPSIAELRAALSSCSTPEWRDCARYLFLFLHELASHSNDNKMNSANVAQVFALCLHPQVPISLETRGELNLLQGFCKRCVEDVKNCLFRDLPDE